jgi:hypothetical protein
MRQQVCPVCQKGCRRRPVASKEMIQKEKKKHPSRQVGAHKLANVSGSWQAPQPRGFSLLRSRRKGLGTQVGSSSWQGRSNEMLSTPDCKQVLDCSASGECEKFVIWSGIETNRGRRAGRAPALLLQTSHQLWARRKACKLGEEAARAGNTGARQKRKSERAK